MKYKVNILYKDKYLPIWEEDFTSYKDAKLFAKTIAEKPQTFAVWIEGYEKIKIKKS